MFFSDKFKLEIGYRTNPSINLLAGGHLFKYIRIIYSYNLAMNDSP
ncbi:MAG TPA: type IX secretion system membrane protein PorP/SprF [Maribacter sp.]|nr:type IX secretion system membrane protein PorP/SprF [Maribacter sp.]HEA79425.1 type IX secretion system membrane protein PorP/SprF [Maribacter sp.]